MSDCDKERSREISQLPEYCPETGEAPRPLVLIDISERTTVDSILTAALARKLSFQYRMLVHAGRNCLAVVGPAGGNTDQFLRSLSYVLQQAAGEDGAVADVLENRLVPQSFSLVPSGVSAAMAGKPAPDDILRRYRLRLCGGASFGSGCHPSTRLAVQGFEAVQRGRDHFVTSVLDVGCGSGILALVCARLGARRVLAVDRDQQALAAAACNVAANGLEQVVSVQSTAVRDMSEAWQLVAANLAVSVLHVLLEDLARVVEDGGFLMLAGFQKGQGGKILTRTEKMGMALLEEYEQAGWRGFLLKKG